MNSIPHAQIVSRVIRRPALRRQLVAQPRETLQRSFDVELSSDVDVVVVEDTATRVHLVVPQEPGLRGPEQGDIAKVLTRFRTDAAFRAEATRDPKGVLQAETGATLPDDLEIAVVVETQSRRVIQLPPLDVADAMTPAKVQEMYGGGGGGGGEYYVPDSSETVGGCSNVDTVTWGCCESDVNLTTILHGSDCCGDDQTEITAPGSVH